MNIEKIMNDSDKIANEWVKYFRVISRKNHEKVLNAFRCNRISYQHFRPTSGYGYGDTGRDTLERLWADILGAEDSIIRQQIVSGTHAISLALFGCLLPGDDVLSIGTPYDTLQKVVGTDKKEPCTLKEMGISFRIHPLDQIESIPSSIQNNTKMIYIQRSKGYEFRQALTIKDIERIVDIVKSVRKDLIVFVDNCYGEFIEDREPTDVGVDLMAGSLIKNPGATVAPSGGYVAGRSDLVERVSFRLTAPGLGKELGPSLISNQSIYQGIYMAPNIVAEALKGAVYIGSIFKALGFDIMPEIGDVRGDIVQAIKFGDRQKVVEFCQGIQRYSPIDSFVIPEDWDMPGYDNRVIMATGGFVEGSSIELSADGPIREPYVVYVQGGSSYEYIKINIDSTIRDMTEKGLL